MFGMDRSARINGVLVRRAANCLMRSCNRELCCVHNDDAPRVLERPESEHRPQTLFDVS